MNTEKFYLPRLSPLLETTNHSKIEGMFTQISYTYFEQKADTLYLANDRYICSLDTTLTKAHITPDMLSQYTGFSTEDHILSILLNEYVISLEKKLKFLYSDMGKKNSQKIITERQLYIKEAFPDLSFPFYVDSPRKMTTTILFLSNYLLRFNRVGRGDFIIINSNHFKYIENYFGFNLNGTPSYLTNNMVKEGKIADIDVIVDYSQPLSDNKVIFGKSTKNNVFFVEGYSSIVNTYVIPNNFVSLVGTGKIVALNGAEQNFLEVDIIIGEKPEWRKIIDNTHENQTF